MVHHYVKMVKFFSLSIGLIAKRFGTQSIQNLRFFYVAKKIWRTNLLR